MSSNVRERLRTGLSLALRQRDMATVAVLRSVLAALDNAGAVPARETGSLAIEATPIGPGTQEVPRRKLSDDDMERLLQGEIRERQEAAAVYEQAGQHERARRLHAEADALAAFAGPAR